MKTWLCAIICTFAVVVMACPLSLSAQNRVRNSKARPSPSWLRSGLIYEVFPRAFSKAGNLNGVTSQLGRLKKLGVTVIWLMPIQPVGKKGRLGIDGSPYSIRNYYAIAAEYGTKADLRRLVMEAHRRGMKVIMDMVADHTSLDSVMLSNPSYYKHHANGDLVSPHGWSDVAALNYSNPALRQYMIKVLIYWVKAFGIDGYRCDAAGMVPTSFWVQARVALDQVNPNILLLAEASKPALLRKAFNIDYGWPLLFKLDDVIEYGAPASELQQIIKQQQSLFPKGSIHMLISDDHDEQRAVVRYGASGALAASALMFTLNGVPLLYNGMEVGDATPSTAPALFGVHKIFWQSGEIRPVFGKFYAFMIPFREHHPALWEGTTLWIHNSDGQHVVTFERCFKGDEILVAINFSNTPTRGTVEVDGTWKEINQPLRGKTPDELPSLSLKPFGVRIFERRSRPD